MARLIEKMVLAVLFVLFLGFNSFFIFGQPDILSLQTTTASEQAAITSTATSFPDITEEQAKSVALTVASGTITDIVDKKRSGIPVFAVEIDDNNMEVEVFIDKRNGNIVHVTREATEEDEETVSPAQLKTISGILTEEQAKALAVAEVGGVVTGFSSEREDGILIYEVALAVQGDTVEVEIDAATGEILEVEWGEDDDED